MENNKRKRILVTYFDKFGGKKNNFSKLAGELLAKQLGCKSLMLKVSGMGINPYDKETLETTISSNNYNRIISLGEDAFGHYDIRFEHIKNCITPSNNFISSIEEEPYAKGESKLIKIIKSTPYLFSFMGACYDLRNFLYDNSSKYGYDWEFIHISRHVESLYKIVNHLSYIAEI